jgi:predicted O-methyltransferase YrrM
MTVEFKEGMSIPDYLQVYLEKKLKEIKPKYALEFGTGYGVATEIIAKYSDRTDTFENDPDFFQLVFKKFGNNRKNVRCFQNYYTFIEKDIKYDFVFIDGPKGANNRIAPLLFHWLNIKSGALCVFDDANQPGIRELFKLLKNLYGIDYTIDNKDRGIGKFVKP